MRSIAACLMAFAQFPLIAVCESDFRITARLLDYADVPPLTLIEAENHASWILQKADVAIEWLECPTSGQSQASDFEERTQPVKLVIKVLPREMMRYLNPPPWASAFILEAGEGEFATYAYVCYPCVQALAERRVGHAWISAVLGSVFAHEVGHLLGVRHAGFGIMHMPWTVDELVLAQEGLLLFTQKEKGEIRAHLHRRMVFATRGNLGTGQ